MKNPVDVAAKWQQNLSRSTDSIRRGIEAVTESPTASAARSADFWQAQVSAARAKDKFVANLNRVSLQDWKEAMITKGLNRIGTGATAAQGKMAAFMQQFLPYVESVAARVRQMPKGGVEEGIARAAAQIRGNAAFRRSA